MPILRLTKKEIDAIPFPDKGQADYFDTELKGFGIRASAKGKVFFIIRRVNGRKVRHTIGEYGAWTVQKARAEAEEMAVAMRKGENPNKTRREACERAVTLKEVFEQFFIVRKGFKERTTVQYKQIFEKHFHSWHGIPVTDINDVMVMKRHTLIGEKHPCAANNAMRLLRTIMGFSIAYYGVPERNPVRRLTEAKAWYEDKRRRTIVKKGDLPKWYRAVMELGNDTSRDYLLFTLFTGMRRNEPMGLAWDDIDFENKTVTVKETKNKEPLVLPLSNFIFRILEERKDTHGWQRWVFPGKGTNRHLVNVQHIVKAVGEESAPFMLHDLRRTFITMAESLDISSYALKRLINHKMTADVTASYIVHDVERLRVPMQRVTDALLRAMEEQDHGNIVEFRKKTV